MCTNPKANATSSDKGAGVGGGIFTFLRAGSRCGCPLKQKCCSPLSERFTTLIAIQIGHGWLMAVLLLERNALKFRSAGGFEIAVQVSCEGPSTSDLAETL